MEKEKQFTWQELKTFCNNLPEEMLTKTVMWWGEERGGIVGSASCLEENYVQSDEYAEPESIYRENMDEGDEEPETIYPKGTPIIYVD